MGVSAHGRYHSSGWVLDLSSGDFPNADRLTSTHETWHNRLQFTTIFGLTVQALWAAGDAGAVAARERGDQLLVMANRTHEEFASWMTELLAGQSLAALRAAYPLYGRLANRAQGRLGSLATEYDCMHAVNAVYRSAMQPSELGELATRDLSDSRILTLPRSARPDHRLNRVTRLLQEHGWPEVMFSDRHDSVQDYIEEDGEEWEVVSRRYYDHCAHLLTADGCPTLSYEGQRDLADAVHLGAVNLAGRPVALIPASASTEEQESGADVAMRALESETVRIRQPQRSRVLAEGADPWSLVSGSGSGRHLFVVIRPFSRLAAQFDGTLESRFAAEISAGSAAVMARSSARSETQRLVVMADLRNQNAEGLLRGQWPVITSVSMRALDDKRVRTTWAPLLRLASSTVLMDLSPGLHFRLWVEPAPENSTAVASRLRYALVHYEFDGKQLVVLVCQLTRNGVGRSRLHIAPMSPMFASGLEVWLASHPTIAARCDRDDDLFEENEHLLSTTISHLLVEEAHFDFKAGERP